MMNQTVAGGFHKAGPQITSKSEGKPIRHFDQQFSNSNASA
jgi:hypothetical protein